MIAFTISIGIAFLTGAYLVYCYDRYTMKQEFLRPIEGKILISKSRIIILSPENGDVWYIDINKENKNARRN